MNVFDNGDGTYDIIWDRNVTCTLPPGDDITGLEFHNSNLIWVNPSLDFGSGTSDWTVELPDGSAGADSWRLNSDAGVILPAPQVPQSGSIS